MQADIFDALNANTRATGNWGKKPPSIPPYPRPASTPTDGPKKKVSVRDIFRKFSAATAGSEKARR